jgi:hypothetical protein
MLCLVMILGASLLSSAVAYSEPTPLRSHLVNAVTVDPLAVYVAEASSRFAVPERWIRAIMRVESDSNQRARSKKGAMGLMQIMPRTWTELRARYGLGSNPYDPHDNILAGAAYIRELHDHYGASGFLAAYNAGPRRYERHLATGRPLPEETQAYVARLAGLAQGERGNVLTRPLEKPLARANASLFASHNFGNSRNGIASTDLHQSPPLRAHTVVDLSALVPPSGGLFVQLGRK